MNYIKFRHAYFIDGCYATSHKELAQRFTSTEAAQFVRDLPFIWPKRDVEIVAIP